MKRFHSIARCGFVLALLVAASLVQVQSQAQGSRPHRIAVFGSSVANGTGDEFGKEGYTGMLREMFAPRGWEVVDQSRGGDTTITMAPRFAPAGAPDPEVRYLLPANPGYVVIGLSLANEGIFEAATQAREGRRVQAVRRRHQRLRRQIRASTTSYRWWRWSIRAWSTRRSSTSTFAA